MSDFQLLKDLFDQSDLWLVDNQHYLTTYSINKQYGLHLQTRSIDGCHHSYRFDLDDDTPIQFQQPEPGCVTINCGERPVVIKFLTVSSGKAESIINNYLLGGKRNPDV